MVPPAHPEAFGGRHLLRCGRWSLHRNYSFITRAIDAGDNMAMYEGYFYAEELGGWVLMSKLQVLRNGMPWGIDRMYSFTEQWSTADFGVARWAQLGPSFVQFSDGAGEWTQVRSAMFSKTSADSEHGESVDANLTDHGREWGLGMGGETGAGVAKSLMVNAVNDFPIELDVWNDLVKDDKLPDGCKGGTCHHRWWIALWRENFQSSSNAPRTAAFILLGLLILGYVYYVLHALGCFCASHDAHGDAKLIDEDEEEEDPEASDIGKGYSSDR